MIDFADMSFAEKPINRIRDNITVEKSREIVAETEVEDKKEQCNVKNFEDINATLDDLYKHISEIDHPLKLTCKSTVIFSGNKNSPLMIVGEAPGVSEDEQALPFVGDSGKLLNKLLDSVGIDRNKVYITNLVFFRPPANRKPTLEEIEFFWPFLQRQIEIQKPKVILALGATASCKFTTTPIARVRGTFANYREIPVLFSFHPSYLLRLSKMQILAQKDFEKLRDFLVESKNFAQVSL